MKKSPLIIIDDKNLRGVLAPSSLVSKEVFEDIKVYARAKKAR